MIKIIIVLYQAGKATIWTENFIVPLEMEILPIGDK